MHSPGEHITESIFELEQRRMQRRMEQVGRALE